MRSAPRTLPLTALLFLPLVLLVACASGGDDGNGGAAPVTSTTAPSTGPADDGGIQQSDNDLLIVLDRGDGTPVEEYRLTCVGVVESTLPDAEAACAHLEGMADPFAPLSPDLACAEVYGGPETAHVTGRWHGRPVDLRLSRTNACRTGQWDSLGPLLPGR